MLIEAPFIIASNWKQPKHPLTVEWINLWCIHPVEYYSTATSMNGLYTQTSIDKSYECNVDQRTEQVQKLLTKNKCKQ